MIAGKRREAGARRVRRLRALAAHAEGRGRRQAHVQGAPDLRRRRGRPLDRPRGRRRARTDRDADRRLERRRPRRAGVDPDTAVSSDDGAAGARGRHGAAAENTSATVEADSGSDGLAIAALAVAVVALAAAAASFLRRTDESRSRSHRPRPRAGGPGRRPRRRQVLLAQARRHRRAHARAGEGDLQGPRSPTATSPSATPTATRSRSARARSSTRKRAVRARLERRPREGHLHGLDERSAHRRPRHEQVLDLQAQVRTDMKKIAVAAVAAAALAVPAAASAHVTLQPREAVAGSFSKMDVRVPERARQQGHDQGRRPPPGRLLLPLLPEGAGLEGARVQGEARHAGEPRRVPGRRAVHARSSGRAKKPKRDRIAPGPVPGLPALGPRARGRRPAASSCSARSRPTSAASAWRGPARRTATTPAPRVTLLAAEPESH